MQINLGSSAAPGQTESFIFSLIASNSNWKKWWNICKLCCFFYCPFLTINILVAQYGVSTNITVQPDFANPNAQNLKDSEIQKMLKDLVDDGNINMIPGSLNYASIHVAEGYTAANANDNYLCSVGMGCSYHSRINVKYNDVSIQLSYSVIPNLVNPSFQCERNCGPFPDNSKNQHIVMLHELAEVATNPHGDGWGTALNPLVEVSDLVGICFVIFNILYFNLLLDELVFCHGRRLYGC